MYSAGMVLSQNMTPKVLKCGRNNGGVHVRHSLRCGYVKAPSTVRITVTSIYSRVCQALRKVRYTGHSVYPKWSVPVGWVIIVGNSTPTQIVWCCDVEHVPHWQFSLPDMHACNQGVKFVVSADR